MRKEEGSKEKPVNWPAQVNESRIKQAKAVGWFDLIRDQNSWLAYVSSKIHGQVFDVAGDMTLVL